MRKGTMFGINFIFNLIICLFIFLTACNAEATSLQYDVDMSCSYGPTYLDEFEIYYHDPASPMEWHWTSYSGFLFSFSVDEVGTTKDIPLSAESVYFPTQHPEPFDIDGYLTDGIVDYAPVFWNCGHGTGYWETYHLNSEDSINPYSNELLNAEISSWTVTLNQYDIYQYNNTGRWYMDIELTYMIDYSTPIPEPKTMFLLGIGLIFMCCARMLSPNLNPPTSTYKVVV